MSARAPGEGTTIEALPDGPYPVSGPCLLKNARGEVLPAQATCAHSGVCTDNLASALRLRKEPWIDADGASVEGDCRARLAPPVGCARLFD